MACRIVSALLPTEVPNELATCARDFWQVHSMQWCWVTENLTYIIGPYAKGQEEGCHRSHHQNGQGYLHHVSSYASQLSSIELFQLHKLVIDISFSSVSAESFSTSWRKRGSRFKGGSQMLCCQECCNPTWWACLGAPGQALRHPRPSQTCSKVCW